MSKSEEITGTTYDGGVTEENITRWKNGHGKVMRIDVVDGEDLHVCYFHRPKLSTMSAVTKMAKTDELKSSEVLYDNCWLGGSPHVREDAVLFLEVVKHLGEMMNACRGSLKNL